MVVLTTTILINLLVLLINAITSYVRGLKTKGVHRSSDQGSSIKTSGSRKVVGGGPKGSVDEEILGYDNTDQLEFDGENEKIEKRLTREGTWLRLKGSPDNFLGQNQDDLKSSKGGKQDDNGKKAAKEGAKINFLNFEKKKGI